jgi:hypothetical protein
MERHAETRSATRSPVTTIIGAARNLLAGISSWRRSSRRAWAARRHRNFDGFRSSGVVLRRAGYVVTNLLVDLSYSALDPRIRSSARR